MEPHWQTQRRRRRTSFSERGSARLRAWLGLWIGAVTFFPGYAAGSDEGVFRLDVRTTYEWDAGSTKTWVWTVRTNQIWIARIPGWSLKVNRGERRLEVYDPGRTSMITLCYSALTNAPSEQELREIVSERHEGFQILGEETQHSGCGSAVVFDLLYAKEGQRAQPSMAAWKTAMIATEGGLIECTLRTSVRSQPELLRTFRRFLVGLRIPPPSMSEGVP